MLGVFFPVNPCAPMEAEIHSFGDAQFGPKFLKMSDMNGPKFVYIQIYKYSNSLRIQTPH